MAQLIKIKRTAVDGKVPITTDLQMGELGINTFNGRMFMKRDQGTPEIIEIGQTFQFLTARKKSKVTDTYLRHSDGASTNQTPIVLPFDCILYAMSAATNGNETWTAEVHNGNTRVAACDLSIINSNMGYQSLDVKFVVGSEIATYCNGNNINRPGVVLFFRRVS